MIDFYALKERADLRYHSGLWLQSYKVEEKVYSLEKGTDHCHGEAQVGVLMA